MIRGRLLSYSSAETPWYLLSPDKSVLRSLLTSVLVTIISYQAAAMVFDLVLGMKREKETKIKMIGILMLAWKSSSPLILLNNILRVDWITRLYYKGDIPKSSQISRDQTRVKPATIIMLILLVTATPVIDVVFVALNLSQTRIMSFAEAGFVGVEVGLQQNLEVLDTAPYFTSCKLAKFESRRTDFIDARFSICSLPTLPQDPQGNLTGLEVVVAGHIVQITVIIRGSGAVSSAYSELQTNEGSFLIKPGLTNSSSLPLVDLAREALAEECGDITETGPLPQTRNGSVVASLSVTCGPPSNSSNPEVVIANILQQKLTLVESDAFLVSPVGAVGNLTDARDLNFLQRSEPGASTFTLICIAVSVLVARTVGNFVLSNDVGDSLEYIVKSRLGLRECDSMFWVGQETLFFRKKFQDGDAAHLGLHLEGLPEVESFSGGIIGGHKLLMDQT